MALWALALTGLQNPVQNGSEPIRLDLPKDVMAEPETITPETKIEPPHAGGREPDVLARSLVDGAFPRVVATKGRAVAGLALVCALALHGAVALAVIGSSPDGTGAGGTDLEAISVDVALVPATALESLLVRSANESGSRQPIDTTLGTPALSNAPAGAGEPTRASESAQTRTRDTTEQSPSKPPIAAELDAAAVEAQIAALLPSMAPFEASVLPQALRPPETPREPVRNGKPVDVVEPDMKIAATQQVVAVPASSGQQAGSAGASRASDTTPAPAHAAAAASPGAIAAFTRDVAKALQKSRASVNRAAQKGAARGKRGTVKIAFTVSEQGTLASIHIAQSSGHDALDTAAVAAVQGTHFPTPPAGLSERQRGYVLPYYFR